MIRAMKSMMMVMERANAKRVKPISDVPSRRRARVHVPHRRRAGPLCVFARPAHSRRIAAASDSTVEQRSPRSGQSA